MWWVENDLNAFKSLDQTDGKKEANKERKHRKINQRENNLCEKNKQRIKTVTQGREIIEVWKVMTWEEKSRKWKSRKVDRETESERLTNIIVIIGKMSQHLNFWDEFWKKKHTFGITKLTECLILELWGQAGWPLYIYIYIYMCVCVCVSVCDNTHIFIIALFIYLLITLFVSFSND